MPITRSWAKRELLTGEHLDGGGPLILLPAPGSHTRLQALITSWHTEQLNVVLTGTQPFAVLQVARFAEGSKLSYSLSGVHFALNLTTWEGRTITWRAGWVQACVFQIGASPHSGHHRALWRSAPLTMAEFRPPPQRVTCDRARREASCCLSGLTASQGQ